VEDARVELPVDREQFGRRGGGNGVGAVDPCWIRPDAGRGWVFSGRPQPCPGAKLDLSFSTRQG
jgi:hypothetical protein